MDALDDRIDALHEKAGKHLEDCLFLSAYRVYGDLKRIGKAEQRAIPYINAVFHQMDLAQSLLDPRTTRANAVELIALLEDEERARLLQPDFLLQPRRDLLPPREHGADRHGDDQRYNPTSKRAGHVLRTRLRRAASAELEPRARASSLPH